ncbi:MAG TPA: tripartite tricarboxylate transporter substrate binding protein [Xanthobacteraceae bacterium]
MLAVAILFAGAARAQDYPTQPIHIIVPNPPGGQTDFLARLFAQKLTERKYTVVVENRSGANGAIAAAHVAKSLPNGYTLFIGHQGTQTVLQHLDPKLPYDGIRDFAAIILLTTGPQVLVVHPSVPAKTVKEVVALSKTKPLTYANSGIGTTTHLTAEQFKLATGTDITGVIYRGAGPANADLLAGHVSMAFDLIGNAMGNIGAGNLRALAVTAAARSPVLPDVPTMAEQGWPEIEAGAWFALFAPANTPQPIIAWLNRQANEIFSAPQIRENAAARGMSLPLGTPEALAAHVEKESKRWGDVIRRAGISLQSARP